MRKRPNRSFRRSRPRLLNVELLENRRVLSDLVGNLPITTLSSDPISLQVELNPLAQIGDSQSDSAFLFVTGIYAPGDFAPVPVSSDSANGSNGLDTGMSLGSANGDISNTPTTMPGNPAIDINQGGTSASQVLASPASVGTAAGISQAMQEGSLGNTVGEISIITTIAGNASSDSGEVGASASPIPDSVRGGAPEAGTSNSTQEGNLTSTSGEMDSVNMTMPGNPGSDSGEGGTSASTVPDSVGGGAPEAGPSNSTQEGNLTSTSEETSSIDTTVGGSLGNGSGEGDLSASPMPETLAGGSPNGASSDPPMEGSLGSEGAYVGSNNTAVGGSLANDSGEGDTSASAMPEALAGGGSNGASSDPPMEGPLGSEGGDVGSNNTAMEGNLADGGRNFGSSEMNMSGGIGDSNDQSSSANGQANDAATETSTRAPNSAPAYEPVTSNGNYDPLVPANDDNSFLADKADIVTGRDSWSRHDNRSFDGSKEILAHGDNLEPALATEPAVKAEGATPTEGTWGEKPAILQMEWQSILGEETPPAGDTDDLHPQMSGLLTNVLPFDSNALENGMQEFFREIDNLGRQLVNSSGGISLASWFVSMAMAAAACEVARRQMRPHFFKGLAYGNCIGGGT